MPTRASPSATTSLLGFGKVDRRCQVCAFAERHTDEPMNVVAKTYEREYGLSVGIAAG